jgi:hypothetical protein
MPRIKRPLEKVCQNVEFKAEKEALDKKNARLSLGNFFL